MVLFDSSATPILSLSPGARHDFIVAHDVKEVGPHTLACSTVYITAAGEAQVLPAVLQVRLAQPPGRPHQGAGPCWACCSRLLPPCAGMPMAPCSRCSCTPLWADNH